MRLYKVTYASVVPELDNLPTVASGLVAVPETGLADMPMVAYQHGTVFDRNSVPSRPDQSMETRIMIARFAAQGYVVIGADYFGRGDFDLPDSYLVKESAQQANLDMLDAAKSVLAALGVTPSHTFLSGWSQGGWATMVFLERLEGLGVPVTAAAVASGPVDVALSVNRWLNNPQPIDAVFLPGVLALQLQADAFYHQVPGIDALAIRPEYLAVSRDLYAGRIDFESFYAKTPHRLAGLHDAGVPGGGSGEQGRVLAAPRRTAGLPLEAGDAAPDLVWRLGRGDADRHRQAARADPGAPRRRRHQGHRRRPEGRPPRRLHAVGARPEGLVRQLPRRLGRRPIY